MEALRQSCGHHSTFDTDAWLAGICCPNGDDEIKLECAESRCQNCGFGNLSLSVTQEVVTWKCFVKEDYQTSKGVWKKRTVMGRVTGSKDQFVREVQRAGRIYLQHHWKTGWLTAQRAALWANPPAHSLILSMDWSNNYERKRGVELTCEFNPTAILCPIVACRRVDPFTDPVCGHTPRMEARIQHKGWKPGDTCLVHEAFVFVSSTSHNKGPSASRYFLKTVLNFYETQGITFSRCVLDTDNCASQYKSGTFLHSLTLMAADSALDIYTINNTPSHNKALTDGLGADVKTAWDAASIGFSSPIDAHTPHTEWAKALVEYGNNNLRYPSPSPWASRHTNKKLMSRQFYAFTDEDLDPVPKAKVLPMSDGFGVPRGIRDCYAFRCHHTSGSLEMRNLFCSCDECLSSNYNQCEHKDCVAPYVPIQVEVNKDVEDVEEDNEEEEGADVEDWLDVQLCQALQVGDVVACLGDKSEKHPVWVGEVVAPVKELDSDYKDRLTKQEYPAGSHVLTVYWCDYGGLDMGPEAPDRVYKVGKEFPGYVFSHLVLCTLQTAPVMDSRGKRPLSGVFKVSQKELEVAIGLSSQVV